MLSSLRSVFAVDPLSPIFTTLRQHKPGVADALTRFVRTGTDPGALMRLAPDDIAAVERECVSQWSRGMKPLADLVAKPNRLTGAQWIRLGQVFAMTPALNRIAGTWPAVAPTWFMALQVCRQRANRDAVAWDVSFAQTALTTAGTPLDDVPAAILAAFFASLTDDSYPKPVDKWAQAQNTDRAKTFAGFVGTNITLVPDALAGVSAYGRAQGARWLVLYPALIQPLTPTITTWAVDSSKTMRNAAIRLLAELPGPRQLQALSTALSQGSAANLGTVIDELARLDVGGRAVLQSALAAGAGGKRDDLLTAALNRSKAVSAVQEVPIDVPPTPPQDLAALKAAVRKSQNTNGKQTINFWRLHSVAGADYDLRNLLAAASAAGIRDAAQQIANHVFGWGGLTGRQPDDVWPFFAENPERLDQALGLAPRVLTGRYQPDDVPVALRILAMFPTLPARYVAAVAQYATGEGKIHRRRAQELLESQPGVLAIAAHTLKDGKSEVRAAGAAWIGRIGDPAAIPALREALTIEKREAPQAAMLNALHRLGDDISSYLKPSVLAAAAKKGLAAKPPSGMAWIPLDALSLCHWEDGTTVAPEIIRWWAVLAVKLKDPTGAGLIPIYVSLLDQPSREALGRFALDAWIAHDTLGPSDEECRAYASAHADARYRDYQQWAKRSPQYYGAKGALTKDQVFEELRREKAREYLGTAIGEKGLLALSAGAPGHHVFTPTQRYIRDHGQRRAQVEALVTAASANDDPAAIQLVLSVARKHGQETVRLKAAELAAGIAERKGWSMDELADRTIPTAGFDDAGLLMLDYGPRCFTGRVARTPKTGAFTIGVFNPDGKPVAALPQPSSSDDEAMAAEARKLLSTSKKELTQVVQLQTARLFEAMCLERVWDAASWREFLLGHPLMSHLVSTLVWQSSTEDGYQLFRPTVEGDLLDADDETVEVPGSASIRLAHAATVSPMEAEQWRAHLADYQIEPLFAQFDAIAPPIKPGADAINDHLGWLSDSFAIRGRATKRGYKRGSAEDGAWFGEYVKDLPGAGMQVAIEFTGSYVPEELLVAAVKELVFRRNDRQIQLTDVPKILLAESYADYVYVAEAGTFNEQWEALSAF